MIGCMASGKKGKRAARTSPAIKHKLRASEAAEDDYFCHPLLLPALVAGRCSMSLCPFRFLSIEAECGLVYAEQAALGVDEGPRVPE